MEYLNLGCGKRYVVNDVWVNADMLPIGKEVLKCNFLNGIPYETNRFSVVYHSHVLEHFSKEDGIIFLKECYRVLNTGGILRIALPNLEKIATEYLNNLNLARQNIFNADKNYDWIMLEMYDQTIRNKSGGIMIDYLNQNIIPNEDYVFDRIGNQAKKRYDDQIDLQKKKTVLSKLPKAPKYILNLLHNIYLRIVLVGKDYSLYKIGKFRKGGEVHQWMYDSYSLGRLLNEIGFKNIKTQTAETSYIEKWASYKLDDTSETASLFIEAIK